MAIDISARITGHFPKTEAKLLADAVIVFASLKLAAIAESKRKVYGTSTVPAEADIPDLVGEQIADLATIRCLAPAREYYALERHRQRSNREGENILEYDLLALMDDLEEDLRAAIIDRDQAVEALIGAPEGTVSVPSISHDGPMINTTDRALARGMPF